MNALFRRNPMPAPCDGLRVLDFTSGMAGGLTTMVLADAGAGVVRVEPRGGDPVWALPAYHQWQRGKQIRELDLKLGEARALSENADVLVENMRPGVMDRLGLGYAALAAINPRLVYCAISGFGEEGPLRDYAGYEGIVGAKSGRFVFMGGQTPRPGP